ncbi:MAG: M48 family metalloprotease [Halioglobus sp.]|nr:M48 family metalloprotease [Halioglobus sp.]
MNFFEQQDLARRNTRMLVLLFLIAVLILVIIANVAVAAFLFFGQNYNVYSGNSKGMTDFLSYFGWARFGNIGLLITATVALVVLAKWVALSNGGKAVAESMGGTRILPQSRDAAERRCLNAVEEMALAANMPVPPLYVLNAERGINAFAAGISPADAVVAVTRGTIEHLKRDELQGVIAHEFSHILNGDMRLNIRLAALLKGITFIGDVGDVMLRSSRVRTGTNARSGKIFGGLTLIGLSLWLLGWLGGAAAGFIKAAISRQKEYWADASAVQLTRSSDGIGDALKVIGAYTSGTLVHAARATEMSHIFFGQIEHRLWQGFATHPPLHKRIQRVDPQWDGHYIEREIVRYAQQSSEATSAEAGVERYALVAAAIAGTQANEPMQRELVEDADFEPLLDPLDQQDAALVEIPLLFVQHCHEPLGAHALVYCLLIGGQKPLQQAHLNVIKAAGILGLDTLITTLYPGVCALGPPYRLPLIERCLPALKSMSAVQYRTFKDVLVTLIRVDHQTDLHEWCLFQLVRHYLEPEFIRVRPSRARHRKLQKVAVPVQTALSVLAYEGNGESQALFRLGADSLGFTGMAILARELASVEVFGRAIRELADCYPLQKPRLLKAMTLTAHSDGILSPTEQEIIASVAAVMDCPLPSLAVSGTEQV